MLRYLFCLVLFAVGAAFRVSAGDFFYASQSYDGASIELSGDWDFYWEQLIISDSLPQQAMLPDTTVKNPGSWNSYKLGGRTLPAFGYASYVTYIEVKQGGEIGIRLKGFYSAYNLYLDGICLGGNGEVGKTLETSSLQWLPQVLRADLSTGAHQLVIEVSNFQHSRGGFFHPVKLGPLKTLQAEREKALMIALFTAGAFLMIGIFFLGTFLTWRQDRYYLIYVLLTVSYAVRILSNGTHALKSWLIDWPWEILVRIEYLSYYLIWWASLELIAFVFPRWIYRAFSYSFLVLLCLVVILPLYLYSRLLLFAVVVGFSCYILALIFLFLRKSKLHIRTFWSMLIFLLLALSGWVMEFLIYAKVLEGFIDIPNLFRLGAVLSLAYLVSVKYVVEFDSIAELKEKAETQKDLISEQLHLLDQQQDLLKVRNVEIETLLKEVHHRVKNNLQLITSLLDAEDLEQKPEKALSILVDSQARIASMSLVHQSLYMNDSLATIPLQSYLQDLIAHLQGIFKNRTISVAKLNCNGYAFDVDTMVPLGLALNELITNSLKYTDDHANTEIEITCEMMGDGMYGISYIDQGKPISTTLEKLSNQGYGLKLASRLCQQLMGDLQYQYKLGNFFRLTFMDTERRKQEM